ncbi:MAG TPA: NlpC/P60 family protein [Flavisolibacter sp.]
MLRITLLTVTLFVFLAGDVSAQKTKTPAGQSVTELKFLEDIIVNVPATETVVPVKNTTTESTRTKTVEPAVAEGEIEKADNLQFKYAVLMDLEVEQIRNLALFRLIDEWFGTRYRLGGTTRNGIDCSALMQVFFSSLYGVAIPRTAREQYKFTRRISRTELREGDLVFFNTIGGVSHVGMYLANNKFVHASTSGVTISDLFDDYYSKRFIGVGRIDRNTATASLTSKP